MNETLQTLGIPFFLILSFLLGYLIAYFAGRSKAAKWMEGSTAVEGKIENLTRQLNQALEEHQKSDQELEDISAHFEKIKAEYNRTKVVVFEQQTQLEKAAAAAASYEQTIESLNQQILQLHQEKNMLENNMTQSDNAADQIAEFQSLLNASLKKIDWLEERLQRLEQPMATSTAPQMSSVVDAPVIAQEPELPVSPDPSTFSPKFMPDPDAKDDFTLIEGIGPFIQGKLYEQGISTYDQLAMLDATGIRELARAIRFLPERIASDDWPGQAAQLSRQKTENPTAFAAVRNNKPDPDHLGIIAGITPPVESVLQEAGIRNWFVLADAEIADLRTILDMAGSDYQDTDPSSWPAQAKLALAGQWELLEEFKRELEEGS